MAVFALLALILLSVGRIALPGWRAMLAPLALALLAAWTLLSLFWTPTGAAAIQYAEHALLYAALAFGGVWVRGLLGRQHSLALIPVAVAGVAVGVALLIAIGTHHNVSAYLYEDATLRYPLGYRNAEAAFLLIAIWPALSLAGDRDRAWFLRAPMLGGAIVLAELAVLAQSRGSVPAAALAALVWVLVSPRRLPAALCLALVAIPVAVATPTLLDVFQYGRVDAHAAVLLHRSAAVVGLTAALGTLAAAVVFGPLEARVRPSDGTRRALGIGLVALTLVVAGGGVAALLARSGGPVDFVNQRVEQFTRGGIPNLAADKTRFGFNLGSNRDDFWRVSLDQFSKDPVLGRGAGSFQIDYLAERHSPESPRDPHSVEMLMLGELGVPGFLLLCLFVGGGAAGAIRSRRLGASSSLVSAAATAALAYWLLHASYEWLWNYPAITAATAYLVGTAIAPAARPAGRRALRFGLAALLAVALVATAPLFLSERYRERALGDWRSDPAAAYTDLEHASSLNPSDPEPATIEGQIAIARDEPARALTALRRAERREPSYYVPYYLSATVLARSHPAAAAAQLRRARELNPRGPQVNRLGAQLARARRRR